MEKEIRKLISESGKINPLRLKQLGITAEQAYNILNTGNHQCEGNNKLKFISFPKGYADYCSDPKCICNTKRKQKRYSKQAKSLSESRKKETEKEKARRLNNFRKTLESKTNQDRENIKNKKMEKWKNKTTEELSTIVSKKQESWRQKIPKEKRKIVSKREETKEKKYNDKNYNNPLKISYTINSNYGVKSASSIHILNKQSLNSHGFKNFIKNGYFNKEGCMSFYNIKSDKVNVLKREYNITTKNIPSKETVEIKINNEFNNIFYINDRKLIKPLEIDLLNEEYKIGIEYNGLMWHSFGISKHSMFNKPTEDKNRHLNKTLLLEEKGYTLLHIFENEWLDKNKKSIWVSIIEDKLNKNIKIGARKCIIKEVETKEARKFVDENHLQGYCNSSIKIGLYYRDNLMSIMTFGKSRFNKDIEYELIRFCTKKSYTLQGGGSKMLNYFEKTYKPKSLISYANRRWSKGNFYIKSGFTFSHDTKPNYFYFHPKENILWSRNKFQKHKLKGLLATFNPKDTETINMFNNNYRKIYDSGNKVFIKRYF